MTESEPTNLLNLNASCGGGSSGRKNAWENPRLTGMNQLPPHSRNIRSMATAYKTKQSRNHAAIPPCVCLDTSSLEASPLCPDTSVLDVLPLHQQENLEVTSEKGWQFRLFPDPKSIPESYVLPTTSSTSSSATSDLSFCSKKTSVPSNWTMASHKECCGVHDPPRYTNVSISVMEYITCCVLYNSC